MKNVDIFKYIDSFKKQLEENLGSLDLNGPSYSSDAADASGRIILKKRAIDVLIGVLPQVSNKSQVRRFFELSSSFEGLLIVLSSSISPKVKDSMRSHGVGYYIPGQEMYLPIKFEIQEPHNTLGTAQLLKTGFRTDTKLAMMLYYMCKPESLQFSQRKLAQILGVSPTSIMNAQKALFSDEVIIKHGGKKYFGNIRDYVNTWRRSFKKVRKKLFLGRFSTKDSDDIRMLSEGNLKEDKIIVSGEAAAADKTKFLSPEVYTFHIYDEKISNFAQSYRLWKDQNGPIYVYKAFWPNELNQDNRVAPDLVVIAELLNSGYSRNIETAEILFKDLEKRVSKYVL